MYHSYFGLREEPFSIAVNPKYLFMSARHRDALAHLLYGVGTGGGFILLTGEVGTGKTTINRALMEQLPAETDIAVILNPALNADELLATVCDELKIDYDHDDYSLKSLTDKLHAFLMDNHSSGRNTVLLIDEAQHLQFDVLEQIRLLTNLETNTRKLLQIVLVGQPELSEMLSRPELRQLNQRITARYELQPLNRQETESYIRHRLQVAGLPASQEIFPQGVVREIHKFTQGIPRLINVLCNRVLLGAYGHNQSRVDMKTLRQAAGEVFGSGQVSTGGAGLKWGMIAALGLGMALAGLLYWQVQPGMSRSSPQQRPAPIVHQEPAGLEESLTESPQDPGVYPEIAAEAPAGVHTAAVSVAEELVKPTTSDAKVSLFPARWEALSELAVYMGARENGDCAALLETGWRCQEYRATTWNEVLSYDQPAVLSLVTPARFARYAVLVGVNEETAHLSYRGEEFPVPLAELGTQWQGGFMFLWRPPEGFVGPVSRGDSGPVVRWLAQQFAEIDQQPSPLADSSFNAALAQRVRMFQRQHDLHDDGVVGVKTLLKLFEQRGLGRPLRRPPTDSSDAGAQ